jgi:hypothetical protein
MPEVIDLVMIVTFLSVWAMIGTDLVSRHARESKLRASARVYRGHHSR